MVCDDCYWFFYISDSVYYGICMKDDTSLKGERHYCPYHISHDQVKNFVKEEYTRRGLN